MREIEENYLENADSAIANKEFDMAQELIQDMRNFIQDADQLISADLFDIVVKNVIANPGEMRYREVTVEENIGRTNYQSADNIDYLDGDFVSSVQPGSWESTNGTSDENGYMYNYGKSSLINNRSRVYKGGGWDDRGYWLSPGTRRFLDENQSSASIGFRCVVDRLGTQANPNGRY